MQIDVIAYHGTHVNISRLRVNPGSGIGSLYGDAIYCTSLLKNAFEFSSKVNEPKNIKYVQIGTYAPVELELYTKYALRKFGLEKPKTMGVVDEKYQNEAQILFLLLQEGREKTNAAALKAFLKSRWPACPLETDKANEIINFFADKKIRYISAKNPHQRVVYKTRVKGNFLPIRATIESEGFYKHIDVQKLCRIYGLPTPQENKRKFVDAVARLARAGVDSFDFAYRVNIFKREEEIKHLKRLSHLTKDEFLYADANYQPPQKEAADNSVLEALVADGETALKDIFYHARCCDIHQKYPPFGKECKVDGYFHNVIETPFLTPEKYYIIYHEKAVEILAYANADTFWQWKSLQPVNETTVSNGAYLPNQAANLIQLKFPETQDASSLKQWSMDCDAFVQEEHAVDKIVLNDTFELDFKNRSVLLLKQETSEADLSLKTFFEHYMAQGVRTWKNETGYFFYNRDLNGMENRLQVNHQGRLMQMNFNNALWQNKYFIAGSNEGKFIIDLTTGSVFSPFPLCQQNLKAVLANLKGKKPSVRENFINYEVYADDRLFLETSKQGEIKQFHFQNVFVDTDCIVLNNQYVVNLNQQSVFSFQEEKKHKFSKTLEMELAGGALNLDANEKGYRLCADGRQVLFANANGMIEEACFKQTLVEIEGCQINLKSGAVLGQKSISAALSEELAGTQIRLIQSFDSLFLYSNGYLVLKANNEGYIKELYLKKPQQINSHFKLPNVEKVVLKNVRTIQDDFLSNSDCLKELEAENLNSVGHDFLSKAKNMSVCRLPNLRFVSTNFLQYAPALKEFYSPLLKNQSEYPEKYAPFFLSKDKKEFLPKYTDTQKMSQSQKIIKSIYDRNKNRKI